MVLFLQQVLGNSGLSYKYMYPAGPAIQLLISFFFLQPPACLGLAGLALGLVLLGSRSPPLFAMSLLFLGMVFP